MSKIGLHHPFEYLKNISYGQKKGRESNGQFDSRPLKVKNRPNFLAFRLHGTYLWKTLDVGYNFASNIISIGGLHTKLCTFKVVRVSIPRISRLTFESPETKCHLGAGPVTRQKNTIRGKVVASPKFEPW